MEILSIVALVVLFRSSESSPTIIQLKSNAITTVNIASGPLTPTIRALGNRRKRSVFDEATKDSILDKHNELRRKPPASDMEILVWNDYLADMAGDWAKQCLWEHGQPIRPAGTVGFEHIGQNLYLTNGTFNPADGVQTWYNEVAYYTYGTGECSHPPCGHYTQVIWSTSREVGCAYAHCPKMIKTELTDGDYLVCNYGPAGNYIGLLPYNRGKACTTCPGGSFWCDDGLCRRDCRRQDTKCSCAANCTNCGSVDRENCTCTCADGYYGDTCSRRCLDTHKYCGANPGWPLFSCTESYVREYCPSMCGLCTEWTSAKEEQLEGC
ncbi:hypothetical protein LSH36_249g01008 [Paralvinella palmiformis]|uniref:SCP domain-containing protein n=1 Tax=Paralvinella palmiformis TaxID=53620 RepID=A0AAD9N5J0_9ANNE|nr:hypothetical protein LSH36_249g01008 [Paralvinella palmiformis]